MTLTRDEWGRVLLLFLGAVLTVLAHLFIREWYMADVRYTTGGAHVSSKCGAISSLGLENWGRATAEDVTIAAEFADPLTDIAAGPMGTHVHVAEGGIGHTRIIGTIKRLVPKDKIYIYFFTEPSSSRFEPGRFIQRITFNDGVGKTGPPVLPLIIAIMGFLVVFGPCLYFAKWAERRAREHHTNNLCAVIQMGQTAAQGGESDEQLRMRVEAYRRTIPWIRRPKDGTLIACAQAAFTGLRQSLTPPNAR